ncbi:phospholipase A [Paraburkholderia sp. MMS20-SJTR3]|uniref:Phospholipase A1 n=1 Tax=Paraburkholderia sejongensis TaxID=2886946 RepID=A0ABS8JY55_9BURK|nr:phospholipase A [Paraburkholderia sp. MMS20-SJTR3]MCC8394584.1 phospholipase A [Paraburkholderia sp. MMS20-SJTR3]
MSALLLGGYCASSVAGVSVLRPPREASSSKPLEVTIVYSGDQPGGTEADVPAQLNIALSNADRLPQPLALTRESGAPEHLKLAAGELKAVRYVGEWPKWARGAMKIDVPTLDVSPSFVMITRPGKDSALASAEGAAGSAGATGTGALEGTSTSIVATSPEPARPDLPTPQLNSFLSRFSSYEPMYFADGSNGENLAKFQLSFKFRMVTPDDPRSRGFLDNLYFAYTQTSLWDLGSYSAPFRDTSYMPAMIYHLDDTGWKSKWWSKMGLTAGYEHESNGRDGPESRGIDTLFVKPIWEFGDLNANHLTVAPKIYYYTHIAGENHDITDYRGYVDLLIKYGSYDGWQLATTLRKGTKGGKGSVDTQFTYPLAKLINNRWGGFLWVGFFTGYGEDILDYNQHRWIARIGYSITR